MSKNPRKVPAPGSIKRPQEPAPHPLVAEVAMDIRGFLADIAANPASGKQIFFNEKDLQVHLAIYLSNLGKYDHVHVEYFIPIDALPVSPWDYKKGPFVDIVVEKDGLFVPVELKYATDPIDMPITRFGVLLSNSDPIVKHHGAQDNTRYDFWKDVKRIEVLKHAATFKGHVVGGIAFFLTNDLAFQNVPDATAGYRDFSTALGSHGPKMEWHAPVKEPPHRKNFTLTREYFLEWTPITLANELFVYLLRMV